MCPKSFGGARFDLGSHLQGRMWHLIPMMDYISLIIGRRGFGGIDYLWQIITLNLMVKVTFDLGPLLQGQMWSSTPVMAYISLTITHGGFGCEDNL